MVRSVLAALLAVPLVACQGEQGPPGPGAGAVSNRYCTKLSNNLVFEYQAVRFASGDVEAICSITDVAAEHSSVTYYRSGDSLAAAAVCWVGYDASTPSFGYWEFRADAPGERATYHDEGSPSDGWVLTFATTDCTG
jgi:hypothetical protein